jgi:hypothetical protein
VKLTFDGIPERLVVTFASIRVFFDPSVRYGLQFEDLEAEPESGEDISQRLGGRRPDRANGTRATLRSTAPKKPKVARKTKGDKTSAPVQDTKPAPEPVAAEPKLTPAPPKADDDKPRQDNGGAQIVRLDAFRKK